MQSYDIFEEQVGAEVSTLGQEDLTLKLERLRGRLFAQQRDFIDDPFQFKTLLTPRRSGKSYVGGVSLIDCAVSKPGSKSIYITLTRGTAKRIMWGTLKKLNDEFELGIVWNNTDLMGTLPNGSTIQLAGSETTADIDKFRGVAFDLVIIDECKSFPTSLIGELVEEVITPCLADRMGSLVMMGTPGSILMGKFYEATCFEASHVKVMSDGSKYIISRLYRDRDKPEIQGVPFQWSSHRWTLQDNVAVPHLWSAAQANKTRNGWSDENPIWRREWLGEWLPDDGGRVYRGYLPERNDYEPLQETDNEWGLPSGHEWKFICGVDLGYDDDFALQVAAYSDSCTEFYQVFEFNEPRMNIAEIARKIREVEAQFGEFETIVGDRGSLGKQIFATLDEVYGVHILASDKQEKRDHIELLNSEMLESACFVKKGSVLSTQMMFVQWDETGKKEDKGHPNHATDAFLYLWRYAYHHHARHKKSAPTPGSIEWSMMMQEEEVKRVLDMRRRRAQMDPSDDGRGIDAVVDDDPWRGFDA